MSSENAATLWGRIDILINNASNVSSIDAADGNVVTTAMDVWDLAFGANSIAPGTYLTDQAWHAMEPLGEENTNAMIDTFARMNAIGRWGNPDDLVAPLLMQF